MSYNIGIIGAGTVGAATACMLKALDPELKIFLGDKRPETTRNHGLNIKSDSIAAIHTFLKNIPLAPDSRANRQHVSELQRIFSEWKKSGFVRTAVIEKTLAAQAEKMGVTVKRGPDFAAPETNLADLFSQKPADNLTSAQMKLKEIFQNADIVIGADGAAKSVVREQIVGENKVDITSFQYLIELKFDTNGDANRRGKIESSVEAAACGLVDIESVSPHTVDGVKPTTLHIFVDKETYDSLRPSDEHGNLLKGIAARPWTLDEINALAATNKRVAKIHQIFNRYLEDRTHQNEVITTIPLEMWQNESGVTIFENRKIVALVGDARSAKVLERGVNAGWIEATYLVEAVLEFYKNKTTISHSVPSEFKTYEFKAKQLFANEKWWAEFKNSWIKAAQLTLKLISENLIQRVRKITRHIWKIVTPS